MKYQTVGTESGSYGNVTFSRSRFGQYKRSRVTPLNPDTPAQRAVRAVLGSLASRWRTLSDAQMSAWDVFAAAKGLTQKGMNAYIQVNALNTLTGSALVQDPPALAEFGILTATGLTATVDAEAGTLNLSVEGAANDLEPAAYIVEATPGLSAGRRNASSAFRVITGQATLAALGGAAGTLGQAYTARFGVPAVGTRLQVRVSQFKDGQKMLGRAWSVIVAAA